jgi:hypothetical protein
VYGGVHAPDALTHRKSRRCTLNEGLGGPLSFYGRSGASKNVAFSRESNHDSLVFQPTALNSKDQNVFFPPKFTVYSFKVRFVWKIVKYCVRPLVMLWSISTFRKRVRNVVTSEAIQLGVEGK